MTSTVVKTIGNHRYAYQATYNRQTGKQDWKYIGKADRFTKEAPRIEIHHADFRDLAIEHGIADLVLTDPPWNDEALPLWEPLSAFAERVLRPGGILCAYAGHKSLPYELNALGSHLTYIWMISIIEPGAKNNYHPARVTVGWRPVLVFYKPPLALSSRRYWKDTITSRRREKDLFVWQQNVDVVRELVRMFSDPGDLVVDPFLGSGTTAIAARGQGRAFIGCELDEGRVRVTEDRIRRDLGLPHADHAIPEVAT